MPLKIVAAVIDPPNAVDVPAIVIVEFAKLAFVIPAVPDKLEFVKPVIWAEPENTPDPAKIVACEIDPPNEVDVPAIVMAEFTKLELATVVDAMSVPVMVPSRIIVEVTLPDPIAATPPVPIVISPDTPA